MSAGWRDSVCLTVSLLSLTRSIVRVMCCHRIVSVTVCCRARHPRLEGPSDQSALAGRQHLRRPSSSTHHARCIPRRSARHNRRHCRHCTARCQVPSRGQSDVTSPRPPLSPHSSNPSGTVISLMPADNITFDLYQMCIVSEKWCAVITIVSLPVCSAAVGKNK